jgi:predicted dienelactone hydrolase
MKLINLSKLSLVSVLLLLPSALALGAEQLYSDQPSVTPELAKAGQWDVGVKTMHITNPQQLSSADFQSRGDRKLTVEVWYPAKADKKTALATYENVTRLNKAFSLQGSSYRDAPVMTQGQYPLVVLSHGYTGYRSIMFYLGEHLASHGYVVVGIDHTDSTTGEVDFAKSPFSGFPSTLINRARDQQFVLDHFANLDSALGKQIDSDNAAVIGYSMGGYGAVNTVGGCYNFQQAGLGLLGFPAEMTKTLMPVFNSCHAGRDSVDPRWKAMVAFAPWGQALNVHKASSLQNIKAATLYVAGDQDDVVGFEPGVKTLFEQTGSDNNYMMVYENARHNFAPHPAPQVAYANEDDLGHYYEPSWDSETLNRINKHMTLAFLDCHVKGSQQRCAYLPEREDITQVKGADGKLSKAWPGFSERWGAGVKFYRGK